MAFTIKCYVSSDDPRNVYKKDLTEITTKTADIKDPFSITEPHFILLSQTELLTCNYIYCVELKRYYFVTNVRLDSGRRMTFECSADDLTNWSQYLKTKKYVIERQEFVNSPLIVDQLAPTFNDRVQVVKSLGSFGTGNSIVLNTTGGGN